MRVLKLKYINHTLLIIIIAINAHTLLKPFWPQLSYWKNKHDSSARHELERVVASPQIETTSHGNERSDEHLVIADILLDSPVLQGEQPYLVHRGIWHRPNSSTPDRGSNTVLVGHRFVYSGESVFYHLDKVAVEQRLALYWNGTKYLYSVSEVKVVAATELEIEAPTSQPQLTLYTCTPLWSAEDRLVVVALPIGAGDD